MRVKVPTIGSAIMQHMTCVFLKIPPWAKSTWGKNKTTGKMSFEYNIQKHHPRYI